jgi:hypothetical protein
MDCLRRVVAVACAIVAIGSGASATVLLPGDLAELSKSAGAIVRGRVVSTRAEWTDGRRRIETIVTLAVDETYKGDLSGIVSIAVPGGVLGRYRSVTIGAPRFSSGDEVVLFLGVRPPSMPYVLGLGQGVFRVQRDARTGGTTVTPPALLADSTESVAVTRGDPSRKSSSLADFSVTLRAAVAGVRVRRSPSPPAGTNIIKGGH